MTDYTATETRVSTAGFDLGVPGITPPSNPNRRGVFLADVVVELGLADQETIDQAQRAAQETERSLERYLLEADVLDEDDLSRAIAERNGLDHVDLDEFEVDMDAAQMVARSAAERYRAVPVASASDGALIVAVQDPFDTLGISDIEVMTRSSVRPAIATARGIDALIEQLPEHAISPPPIEQTATVEPIEETIVDADESSNGAGPPPAASEQVEPPSEPEPVSEFEPEPVSEPEPMSEPEPVSEFEPEPVTEPEPVSEFELESLSEPEAPIEPELEPLAQAESLAEFGADPETHSEEPEFEVVQFPEPEPEPELELVEEETPHDDVVFDLKPDLVQLPEAVTSGDAGVSGLESELGALQETARRADELAATVERRIDELKSGADERTAQVEADLTAAQRRVEELEAQVSGVDTLAEELRATTAKLEEVNRVLEGSVR
jgi:hypothetical protein